MYSYQRHLRYSELHKSLDSKVRSINKNLCIISNNQNVTARHVQNDVLQQSTSQLNCSNDLPIKCKICFKILKTQSYLSAHMRLHSGVKPFKCFYCNKYFRFKSNLRIHCKREHL